MDHRTVAQRVETEAWELKPARIDFPVVLHALRQEGADAGYAVDGSLGELAAEEFLSLGVVTVIDAVKPTESVEAGDDFEIEAATQGIAQSPFPIGLYPLTYLAVVHECLALILTAERSLPLLSGHADVAHQ